MEMELYNQAMWISGIVGGIAFATSGFIVGARKKLDLMGILILAFLTANGGGVLRDLLTGQSPAMMKNAEPFWLVGLTVLACIAFRLQKRSGLERSWIFILSDGIGLVAFGITGAMTGITLGVHFFGVLTLSLLTAVGGGIIRDLLVNEVPEVLHGGFYGSVALLLGCALFALHVAGWMNPVSIMTVFAGGISLRLVAYHYKWSLPKITG